MAAAVSSVESEVEAEEEEEEDEEGETTRCSKPCAGCRRSVPLRQAASMIRTNMIPCWGGAWVRRM